MAKLYSVGDAAKRLHKDPSGIRRWCREGRIKTQQTVGGEYLISESEIEKLEKNPPKVGRPPDPSSLERQKQRYLERQAERQALRWRVRRK